MLCRAGELNGYTLGARDGELGTVGDFYFDDRSWTVQHLIAHTGRWLSDRLVLIPSAALRPAKHDARIVPVDLTTQEIARCDSPKIGRYTRHPPHLQSMWSIIGCHLQAADGELGHIEDFVIDDATWIVRYLIADTRNWWPGKRVLLAPQWVERVNWTDSKVWLALHRDTIEQAPEYTADAPITREYEAALYRHYQREQYW